ncbi:hypothetical protein AB4037_10595 [Labrys sp. KB_33_2]|uniref:hypothetical protein n=1 Tax=Labrys sp. KB_33_2 TaxID=3237479 RepID=UPI003F939EFE
MLIVPPVAVWMQDALLIAASMPWKSHTRHTIREIGDIGKIDTSTKGSFRYIPWRSDALRRCGGG